MLAQQSLQDASWSMLAVCAGGVTVGDGCTIAAGAVVTKNVEPWTVVGGQPCKADQEDREGLPLPVREGLKPLSTQALHNICVRAVFHNT